MVTLDTFGPDDFAKVPDVVQIPAAALESMLVLELGLGTVSWLGVGFCVDLWPCWGTSNSTFILTPPLVGDNMHVRSRIPYKATEVVTYPWPSLRGAAGGCPLPDG